MYIFLNIESSILLTILWIVLGLVIYYFLWVRNGTAKTPVLNPKTSIYMNETNDFHHTNIFTFIWQVQKILYVDHSLAFINRYGLEMYFYFALRIYFLKGLIMALSIQTFAIIIVGLSHFHGREYSALYYIKLRIFGGGGLIDSEQADFVETDLEILTGTIFNSIAANIVSLSMTLTVYMLIKHYNKNTLLMYYYSEYAYEKYNQYTNFYFNVRTVFDKNFLENDLNCEQAHKKIEQIKKNNILDPDYSCIDYVECYAIPDFAEITKISKKRFDLINKYEEDIKYPRKILKCLMPKNMYNKKNFVQKMNLYNKKIKDLVDPDKKQEKQKEKNKKFLNNSIPINESDGDNTVKCKLEAIEASTFGFIFMNSVTAARSVAYEIAKENSDAFKLIDYIEKHKKEKQFKNSLLDLNRSIDDNLQNNMNNSPDTNKQESRRTSYNALKDIAKTQAYLTKMSRVINEVNPFDPSDQLWYNIGVRAKETLSKKCCFALMIISMFIFFTTPTAFINSLTAIPGVLEVINLEWVKDLSGSSRNRLVVYIMTVLTLVSSSLFLVIAGYIANGKKFPSKSQYHLYQFSVTKYYQLINFVIMPGLFVGSLDSFFTILKEDGEKFTWKVFVESFRISNGGNYFINLIVTRIGIYFLLDAQRHRDIIINGNFSPRILLKIWNKFSANRWAQHEDDIFQMGSRNAIFCVFMILGTMYGYGSPLILLSLIAWIFMATLMDAMTVIQFHKRECEKFGLIFSQALWYILRGLIFCHVIFIALSTLNYNNFAVLLNFCTLVLQIVFYQHCVNTFKGTGIIQETISRQYSSNFDNHHFYYWLKLYSHPLLSQHGNKLKDHIKKKASPNIHQYLNNFVFSINMKSALTEYCSRKGSGNSINLKSMDGQDGEIF